MRLRVLGDNETPSQLHGCTRCPPAQKKQISMPAGFGHHEQTVFVVQLGHQDHERWGAPAQCIFAVCTIYPAPTHLFVTEQVNE
jgi:hypothetical protein